MFFQDDLVRRVLAPEKKDMTKCTAIKHKGVLHMTPELIRKEKENNGKPALPV